MSEVTLKFYKMDETPPNLKEVIIAQLIPAYKQPRLRVAGFNKGVFYEITTEEVIPREVILAWARMPLEIPLITLH